MDAPYLVIIPTYNEIQNIQILLDRILQIPFKLNVLVIDDSSPDGTGQIVRQLAKSHERIELHSRHRKEGVASAFLFGLSFAIEHDFKWAICMDSDLSHRVEDLEALLNYTLNFPEASLVIGSRYVSGGKVTNVSRYRRLLSQLGNYISRLSMGTNLMDVTGGFRAYNVQKLKSIHFGDFSTKGYGFQMQLIDSILKHEGIIHEMPIDFMPRLYGKSKLTLRVALSALFTVGSIGWNRVLSSVFQGQKSNNKTLSS